MNSADNVHWRNRNKLKKQWEILVWAEILNRRPILPLEFARVELTRFSSIEPDFENMAQGGKWILDSLVSNGVIRDDKPSVIGHPAYRWEKTPPKKGKIVCRVTQLSAAPTIT